jgi:hypothetical protein
MFTSPKHYGLLAAMAAASMGVTVASSREAYDDARRRRPEPTEEEIAERQRRLDERKRLRELKEQREREALAAEATRPKSRQELRRIARKEAKRLRPDRNFQKNERRP